jgi:N utilization substance protein B
MMYRFDVTDERSDLIPATFWEPLGEVPETVKDYAFDLFKHASYKVEAHDEIVKSHLKDGWNFDRIGDVEKNILRVALYELFEGNTPYYAVINDFVTLAKKFSDDKAASLVNGILDTLKKEYKLGEE